MSRTKLLLQLTALVASITTQTTVCIAQQHFPCEAYRQSAAIFVGKVTGIEPISIKVNSILGEGVYPARLIRYSVDERFKGEPRASEEAVGEPAAPGQPDIKLGEHYLVFTFDPVRPYEPDKKAQFVQPLSQAPVDLVYLRSFQKGEPVASVTGKVIEHRLDVINWSRVPVSPPPNVRIFLENRDGLRHETRTDDNNSYRFDNVPPGIYKIIISTPRKLYTPVPAPVVDLIKTPCSNVDFALESDGRVNGKIVDAEGKPAINVAVSLVPVELMPANETVPTNRDLHSVGTQTDEQGRYEIRSVPPGRYVLGVNLGPGSPEPGWNAFPRTFYPGTPDRSQATILEVSEADQKVDQDFRLPPRLVKREIKGSVVFANGSPAPCALVGLFDPILAKDHRGGQRTGNEGQFTLTAPDGYKYAVQAHVPVFDNSGRWVGYLSAPSVEVIATEKTDPVRLVMPPEANCDFLLRPILRP
jgi:hypothetical protein